MFIPIGDENPVKRTPFVTYGLIAANVLVLLFTFHAVVQAGHEGGARDLFLRYGLVPARLRIVNLFTSAFLHGGILHLVFNMLFLYIFGDNVEDSLGHGFYLLFYLLCAAAAGLTYVSFHRGGMVPCVGASGAVSGVLGAYAVLHPHRRVRMLVWIYLFVTVVRVRAVYLILSWLALQMIALHHEATQDQTAVAYSAHAGGFLVGALIALCLRFWAGRRPATPPRTETRSLGMPPRTPVRPPRVARRITYRRRPGGRMELLPRDPRRRIGPNW